MVRFISSLFNLYLITNNMNSQIMTTADINILFRLLYTHPFDGNIWKLITLFIHENKTNSIQFILTDNPLNNHQSIFKIPRPNQASYDRMRNSIVKYKSYKVAQQLFALEELFGDKSFILFESNGDRWYHQNDNTIVYVNSGIGFIDAMVENLIIGDTE